MSTFLRYVLRRSAQRRRAAVQLGHLARTAGLPLIAGTALLQLVIGLAPVAFLVCVSEALAGVDTVAAEGWGGTVRWLTAALSALVIQQLLLPVQVAAAEAITVRVDGYVTARLMRAALTGVPLEKLERADVADHLNEANIALDDRELTPGSAVGAALALTARYWGLAGIAVVLAVAWNGWAAALAVVIALVNRRGQTNAFHRWGAVHGTLAAARRRMTYLRDLVTSTRAAKEIRILGLADWLDARYRTESDAYLHPLWRSRRATYGPPFLAYTLLGLAGGAALLVPLASGSAAGRGHDLAALVIAVQAIVYCVGFGVYFPEADLKLQIGREAWEALREVERLGADPRPVAAQAPPAPVRAITAHGLSFHYGDRDRPVLDGLDLTVPVGASTAIVGLNGAGKTTLVKLMSGLYQPTGGHLAVDGTPLTAAGADGWRRHLAVTFQDFVRYELSVRENVAMSAIRHLDDTGGIREVLGRVGMLEVVAGLPDGLDTPLSRHLPGGTDLSGGQWQRLALARSLFAVRHGASVLVLDEPTAQLDARGEAEFYDTFLSLTHGMTSVIISHRFSSVRRADHIVVLEHGRITERGTHDQLVAAGNTYSRMFQVQASRFVTTGEGR